MEKVKKVEAKYLAYISFDCNDGDYVYGSKVVTKTEMQIIKDNPDYEVSFGSCDFGGDEGRGLSDCISFKKITEDEYKILKKFGFDEFGEGGSLEYIIAELEEGNEGDDEEELEDEDED